MKGLGKRTRSGLTWTLLGTLVANGVRVASVPALARLLSPAEFGLVAVALSVVAFASRFSQFGLGTALIQRTEIEDAHVATTASVMLGLGAVIAAAIVACADGIAALFRMPAATDMVRALAALFVIRALSSTSRFLLHREMRFKALAAANVAAYVLGTIVTIVLAALGLGTWALVIGYLAEATIESALILVARPVRLRPRFVRRSFFELAGFGGGQTLASVASYFAQQGDYIVVGRAFGEATLGIYTRAYELMRFPAMVFQNVAGSVLFSSFAKLQQQPARLEDAFRRVLFINAVVLMPGSAGLIVLAPEVILLVFGPAWSAAVLPLQIMAVSLLFRTSYKAAGLIARSTGDIMAIARNEFVYAGLVFGGAALGARWGMVGVSISTSVAIAIQYVNVFRIAARRFPSGWRLFVAAHADAAALTAIVLATSVPLAALLRAQDLGWGWVLALVSILGGAPAVLTAVAWLRGGRGDWAWLREQLSRRRGRQPEEGDA